ncbi:hypothetical protein F9874_07970 [Glaesserella parasuis]|uniref:Uncharacterized protein n=1 Tax=Glaesserella parasuis TaxID=738 RepID=A0A859IGN4_GLAPU|nr:hypothetical protein [Glaesserella parasuis]MDG6268059.1 hypothetical protein [Glaesserella parasuis]MDO9759066.1 hypothetical protein [Glaesserella parasuis]MDP0298984.1 hypothetical protein [Glaesserella parasuis]MWQ00137.1 hypothetical protein [Glaesserella parasuis]MWQ41535.1 hypothetical protein [Glaesserella parasuis]
MHDLIMFDKKSLNELLFTKNSELQEFEDIVVKNSYSSFQEVLIAHNIILNRIDEREKELDRELFQIEEDIKINSECDKWDYIFSVSSGVIAGLVDSFFVGSPKDSKWLSSADKIMDNLVQKFAKLNGWEGPKGNADPTKSAIGFLERNFKVNYDQRHSKDVSGTFTMSASNHHLKSLSHSPSPIGLIFSIIDQFNGTASFIDNGYLITIDSESNLQGSNFPSKLFAAFYNWIGHIMSDIAGSSGASGRGSGVPIPFYELLCCLNIGSFGEDKKTFAEIAVKVFEQGYDFRFGMVLSIPVLMVELFNRIFCIIRHRYQYNRSWSDCLQFLNFDKNPRTRKMLLVGQGTLCLIDAGDAFIKSGGSVNWVGFFSRMNFIAWMRLSYLGMRHAASILSNEINLQRYQLRAKSLELYSKDIQDISEKFLVEHDRKVNKFFLDRRTELNELISSLDSSINTSDHLATVESVRKISSMYNIKNNRKSFKEFNDLIDDDEY